MTPFTIKREQFFTANSINALQSLIGKNELIFVFKNLYIGLAKPPYMDSMEALLSGYKWEGIIGHSTSQTTESSIQIAAYLNPVMGGEKEIVVTNNVHKRISKTPKDWNVTSRMSMYGELKRIEIYHHKAKYNEYDTQTLNGHPLTEYYSDAPKYFSHLITEYDYFVYLVFHLEDNQILIVEKTDNPHFFDFFTDNAVEKLAVIKSDWNDETNSTTFYLVHAIE